MRPRSVLSVVSFTCGGVKNGLLVILTSYVNCCDGGSVGMGRGFLGSG